MSILDIAPKETQKDRLNECVSCPRYSDSFKLFGIVIFKHQPQCKECKCFINAVIKLKGVNCPLNKW